MNIKNILKKMGHNLLNDSSNYELYKFRFITNAREVTHEKGFRFGFNLMVDSSTNGPGLCPKSNICCIYLNPEDKCTFDFVKYKDRRIFFYYEATNEEYLHYKCSGEIILMKREIEKIENNKIRFFYTFD